MQIEQEEEESAIDAKRRKRLGECLPSNSSVQQLPCGGIYDSCISCRAAAFAFSVPSSVTCRMGRTDSNRPAMHQMKIE